MSRKNGIPPCNLSLRLGPKLEAMRRLRVKGSSLLIVKASSKSVVKNSASGNAGLQSPQDQQLVKHIAAENADSLYFGAGLLLTEIVVNFIKMLTYPSKIIELALSNWTLKTFGICLDLEEILLVSLSCCLCPSGLLCFRAGRQETVEPSQICKFVYWRIGIVPRSRMPAWTGVIELPFDGLWKSLTIDRVPFGDQRDVIRGFVAEDQHGGA